MRLEQKAGKRLAVAVEGDAGIYASVHYVLDLSLIHIYSTKNQRSAVA